LVTRGNKVYWKTGVDSHEGILDLYKKQDSNLNDEKTPPLNTFARIEIVPPKEDYLNTNFGEWIFQIDESIKPSFLKDKHADLCRQALLDWTKVIYTFNLEEARKPIHPFKIVLPSEITEEHLALLKQWDSVRDSDRDSVRASVGDSVWDSVRGSVWDSVRDSVRGSVWASVRGSVWASVRDSVWASVRDSVGDSVWAYVGSLFPLSEWKYIDYKNPLFEKGKYPFQSVVDLWKLGLVPSWDGKVWRLHGGEKAEILWKGTV
jgi:hypothetical protein